ncbi:MAG: arylamine n-acetyltransferase [Acidimicrobiales bacterium]|nr:arylamine n-acetyltransferase [Acidimicrobiales bacterium]
MLVRVELDDGSYVVDAGFGGLTLTGVPRLETDAQQRTPHEPFRLAAAVVSDRAADPSQADGELQLQAPLDERWRPLYQFNLQPQQRIDYEVASWYVSTLPTSLFVQHLMAGRPTPDRRFGLIDNTLTVRHRDGPSERTVSDRSKRWRPRWSATSCSTSPE